jgi:anti-sigma-K factor RskA
MECQRDPEYIAAYVDGELGPAERADVETHLAACAPCRELAAAEQRLGELFAALEPVEPPGDFEARFWARIAREREAARKPSAWAWLWSARWLSVGVGAAALALLLLLPRMGGDPMRIVPEADAPIVANSDDFDLVQDPDMDAISEVDVLENWDDGPGNPNDAPPS